MEWIQLNIGWIIAACSTFAGIIGFIIRRELQFKETRDRVTMLEADYMETHKLLTRHLQDESKHANGKAVEALDKKVDRLGDELVDTRKSIEIKIDNLFEKLYDQKK